jgi:hypothetical protein
MHARWAAVMSLTINESLHENCAVLWGFDHLGIQPFDGSRFPFEQRWPGVLQTMLGSSFHVIEGAQRPHRRHRFLDPAASRQPLDACPAPRVACPT